MALAGAKLVSTSGIRHAPLLRGLTLERSKTNAIALDELARSQVSHVRIDRPRVEDLRTIAATPRIRSLALVNPGKVDPAVLASLQLECLDIVNAKNAQLGAFDAIDRIEKLWLARCTVLERLTPPNTKLSTLWIEACNKLELASIAQAPGLKTLRIMSCRQPLDLTVLDSLPQLEDVSFALCKLVADDVASLRAPGLKRFWVNPASNELVNRISQALPAAKVCNGDVLEIGGVRQPDMQAFYETQQFSESGAPG